MKNKIEIINNAYLPILKYIDDNSGWGSDLKDSPEYELYCEFQDKLLLLDGKNVEITFNYENDFLSVSGGVKKGKIAVEDGRVLFFEGRKRTKYQNLDAGLYSGFFATLIPIKVVILN